MFVGVGLTLDGDDARRRGVGVDPDVGETLVIEAVEVVGEDDARVGAERIVGGGRRDADFADGEHVIRLLAASKRKPA